MTTEQEEQIERDLETLLVRARNTLPTLRRVAEDAKNWRKDICAELLMQLEKAIDIAEANQIERRRHESQ